MQTIDVDGIAFTFPINWMCSKYDEWAYYKSYAKHRSGTKAVDLLAIDPSNTAWLIEVKDYRACRRTKPSDLSDEVAQKVHDTLAAVLAARTNASDVNEQLVAQKVIRATKLRVVLHLEQPAKHSKLFPRAIDPATVRFKLKTLLKPVDAHPVVVEINQLRAFGWTAA